MSANLLNVRDHKRGKWHQSRNIQAALISTSVFLFVSFVGWMITLRINRSSKVSGSGVNDYHQSTRPNTVSGPDDKPVGNHKRPDAKGVQAEKVLVAEKRQPAIQPEDVEGDVNRPEVKPLKKGGDKAIAPQDIQGEVEKQEQKEIIRKRDEPIEPEAVEGRISK